MTTAVQTLNCTVGEIEELLAKGVPVEQIARDLQEPRQNVVAVWSRWRQNNEGVALPPPTPRPVAAVPAAPATPQQQGHRVDESAIAVNALVAAAGRSSSKRTQTLGVRLADLAKVVRDRLAEERAAAEQAEATRAEQEKARADIARLEAQLRQARAKLAGPKRPGGSPAQREQTSDPTGAVDPKVIRAWARENGHEVPPVGRVPKHIVAAYQQAQGGAS